MNLTMSQKERDRLKLLPHILSGEMTVVRGAELLSMSERQLRRVLGRYASEGDEGLVHRGRGRESKRRHSESLKEECLEQIRKHYIDFGPTLASEQLCERHGLMVNRETLRKWMKSEGLYTSKKRRGEHRQWRARRDNFGELVQVDTSEHDWLEGRGEKIYLIALIDDATSRLYARFYLSDSMRNNMDLLKRYMQRHGRPVAVYSDRASHFVVNRKCSLEEELTGLAPRTQIGRALDELGVGLILAHSPQAKGRVERLFGTLQDRLVKVMRLEGVSRLEEANEYLTRKFMPMWNRRFARKAQSPTDVHRSLDGYDLGSIFSVHEERTVTNDYSFSLNGQRYQIGRRSMTGGLRGGRIVTEERLDGKIRARFRGVYLDISLIPGNDKGGVKRAVDVSAGVESDSASLRQTPPPPIHRRKLSRKSLSPTP